MRKIVTTKEIQHIIEDKGRIIWHYQNPDNLSYYQAFMKSNKNTGVFWVTAVVLILGVTVARSITGIDFFFVGLFLIFAVFSMNMSAKELLRENHKIYGFNKNGLFSIAADGALRKIAFNDLYDMKYTIDKHNLATIEFDTLHIGKVSKGFEKVSAMKFINVVISEKDMKYLADTIKIKEEEE